MTLRIEDADVRLPCEAAWNDMVEVPGGRHCGACDLVVHDLSSMTETEARRVLARRSDGRVCVRYQPFADGTIRTLHEPLIAPSRLLAKARPAALAAAAMLASACGPAIDVLPSSVQAKIPYGVELAFRDPVAFTACVLSPSCDALSPPPVAGGG